MENNHFDLALETLKQINPDELTPQQQKTLLEVLSSKVCQAKGSTSALVNQLKVIITLL